jgi:hypothetical protein
VLRAQGWRQSYWLSLTRLISNASHAFARAAAFATAGLVKSTVYTQPKPQSLSRLKMAWVRHEFFTHELFISLVIAM